MEWRLWGWGGRGSRWVEGSFLGVEETWEGFWDGE